MDLPPSHRISRVLWYSGYPLPSHSSLTGISPSLFRFSNTIQLKLFSAFWGPNPYYIAVIGLGSYPFARHYLGNRFFTFFSSGYLDVSVPRVPFSVTMYSSRDNLILLRLCSHIRISMDHSSFATPHSFSQLITSFFGV